MTTRMKGQDWGRTAALALAGSLAAMTLGCSPAPNAVAAVINDKVYTVTPASIKVEAGIVTGEMTDMKITERVEAGSGRVANPARLTGKLALKNTSADQSVRLIEGKILFIDADGKTMNLEDNRTPPIIKVGSGYGAADRLDPGQDASQMVDADFPVEALKASRLREIRIALTYIPSPFREETLRFNVAIGGQ